jgi:hypothetical protein
MLLVLYGRVRVVVGEYSKEEQTIYVIQNLIESTIGLLKK